MPITIGAGVSAATGLISGISGLFQKAKARRLAANNPRPVYEIPGAVNANQQLAQTMANQGMPGAQYAKQQQAINRNASNAMAAAQTRRGGLASVGAIQQGSNDASLNLNSADSQARLGNIRNLMQQNNVMAQYQDKMWGWNQQAKYQENAAAVRALNGAGDANINTGLNGLLSAGAGMASKGFGGGGGNAFGFLGSRSYRTPTQTVSPFSTGYGDNSALMDYLGTRNNNDMYVGG